jgi:hypothetical protein
VDHWTSTAARSPKSLTSIRPPVELPSGKNRIPPVLSPMISDFAVNKLM